VEKDLRASLVAAGAAAALSALVGIIAGVGFFILFLRAVVGGALIGAAVYGALALLKSFLPGIGEGDFSPEAEASPLGAEAADPEIGAHVDIVLPGEAAEVEAVDAEPFAARIFPEGEAESDFAPEVELLEPEGQSAEAEPAIPANAKPERERRSPSNFDELDVLPDLDGFTDSFTASEFAFGASSAERAERSPAMGSVGGSSSSQAGREGADPAMLAQAVRTILKRDQKG
jgi:hypothetical protein